MVHPEIAFRFAGLDQNASGEAIAKSDGTTPDTILDYSIFVILDLLDGPGMPHSFARASIVAPPCE